MIGTDPSSDIAVLRIKVPASRLVAPRRAATDSPPYLGLSLTGAGVVAAVEPGSPTAAAGLRQGDDITAIGAQAVSGARAVGAAIAAHEAGDQVVVTVNRNGESCGSPSRLPLARREGGRSGQAATSAGRQVGST